ncbi:hypothetical protein ACEPAH_4390 [Sanghuangporus vaninii]
MAHIYTLSLTNTLLLDLFCALIVHRVYNKYEIEPANFPATLFLLIVVPALPCFFLVPHAGSVALAIPFAYLLFYFLLASSIVLYRISPIHPLAKHPGPFSLKISKFVGTYHASTGKQYRIFKNLHEKYGPVVRIGPNELSIVDAESIPTIMSLRKGSLWDAHNMRGTIPAIVGMRDVEMHRERRKLWNHGFTTAALKKLQPTVENRVLDLSKELEKRTSKPGEKEISLDLALWMSNFTYDVMGDMVFSGGFSLMHKGDEGGTRALLQDYVEIIGTIQHIPWIAGLMQRLTAVPEGLRKYREFASHHYDTRKSQGATRRDLFYYIMNEEGLEDIEVPRDQGLNDILTAIGAGADTTSTVLAAIFFYLLSNQAVFMRLRKEVDFEFPVQEGDPLDTLKLARMPYLNAIINEVLRLQPPVATSLQRCPLEGSGGVMVGGRLIPESTSLYVPPYPLHRDERYFSPSPNSFIPDRWLESKGEKFTTDVSAFIPFAVGRANCAGKNLALMEMRMVVATIVQRFDMKFAEGYDPVKWEEDLEDFFIMKVGKLPVVLHARR